MLRLDLRAKVQVCVSASRHSFSGILLLAWLSAGLHICGFVYLHTDRTRSRRTLQGGSAVWRVVFGSPSHARSEKVK